MQTNLSNSNTSFSQATVDQPQLNRGLTIDELRSQRAKSLIRLEMEKMKVANQYATTQSRYQKFGLRSLMFSDGVISNLKMIDYILLGYKVSKKIYKLWRKFH